MSVYGYMTAWILFFLVTSMVLRDLVIKTEKKTQGVNIDMYVRNLVEMFIMNFLIVLITLYTLLALVIGKVHWFWLVAGISTTFLLYIFNMIFIKVGERYSEKDLKIDISQYKEETIDKKIRKNKILFYVSVLLNLVVYTFIILNAWDFVPIKDIILPPLMPIFYHLIVDWMIIGLILTMNFMVLAVIKDWLMYVKIKKEF